MSDGDHVAHSRGGRAGHWTRRAIHVSMLALPWLWYARGERLAGALGFGLRSLAWCVLGVVLLLEALRVWRGITLFGMRDYEAMQVSAVAWGSVSVVLTLLFAPTLGVAGAGLGAPIIVSLALVDPLMGELRRARCSSRAVALAGLAATAAVWWAASAWLGTPAWLAPAMAPLTVAAEWPRLRWIDDNASMTLVPLAACLALQPLLS